MYTKETENSLTARISRSVIPAYMLTVTRLIMLNNASYCHYLLESTRGGGGSVVLVGISSNEAHVV